MTKRRAGFGPVSDLRRAASALLWFAVAALAPSGLLQAETVKNPIAIFAALDKVTGRISHLEIPINKTVQFGALKVTPRVCDTRPPTEAPDTASFVEVDEVKLTGEEQRIFTGWMFAESPGLHAVEHPVFDVWLTSCKTPSAPKPTESSENVATPPPPPADTPPPPAVTKPKPSVASEPTEPPPLPWATTPPANAASRSR
jgi:hypothetical protein